MHKYSSLYLKMQPKASDNFTKAVSVFITPSCFCNVLLISQIFFFIWSLSSTAKSLLQLREQINSLWNGQETETNRNVWSLFYERARKETTHKLVEPVVPYFTFPHYLPIKIQYYIHYFRTVQVCVFLLPSLQVTILFF